MGSANLSLSCPVLLTDDPEAHFGFPRLARAHSGDLLLCYRIGTTHAYDDAVIGLRVSADGGRSWSEMRVLWSVEPGCSAHNPVPLVTPAGRVLLWASRFEYGPPPLRHPCWWSHSDDDGRTWAPFTPFDPSSEHNCYYVTEAVATSAGLLAGDATFPPSGAGSCHTRIWHSADGRAWNVRSLLTDARQNHGDEIALTEVRPGSLLCILRDRARTDIYRLWSHDGGHTWSLPESIRGLLDCVLQRPFLTRLGEGLLLLTGRDFERRRVVAYLSQDDGRTFGDPMVLDDYQRDGGYTTALPAGEGRCLIAWYSDSHTTVLRPDIKLATLSVRGATT